MAGLNKIMIIGNLGKDPESFSFDDGTKKVSFSVAVTESYKDKQGNKVDNTEWFSVVAFKGIAEVCEKYLNKGSSVYIEGKLKQRTYEDKEGNKRYITEIICNQMVMLGSKQDSANNAQSDEPTNEPPF
jgi:single-strand DNA-binding protein